MPYGLTGRNGAVLKLKKLECDISASGEIVICTLDHHYVNESENEVYAKYMFPYSSDITVIDFSARVGVEKLENEIVPKNDGSSSLGFYYEIDKIPPGEQIITTVKFLVSGKRLPDRTRITFPLLAEQSFLPFGNQYTFDSYLDADCYNTTVNFVYHGIGVTRITSPTHKLRTTIGGHKVTAYASNIPSNASELVIDVYSAAKNAPEIYKYHDILGCFFTPKIERFGRMKNDWLFMIDLTDKRGGNKFEMMCHMLELAVRGLRFGDRFNVIFMKENPLCLSDDFLPVTDGTLRLLSAWLADCDLRDKPSFINGIRAAYKMRPRCTAVILSEGGCYCDSDTFEYVRDRGLIKFYGVAVGTGAYTEYLRRLCDLTGGRMKILPRDKRMDDEFIREFNIITSPVIKKIGVAMDEPVREVAPGMSSAVHYGDTMSFTLDFDGVSPTFMKVQGSMPQNDCIWNIPLDKVVEGGEEIKYYHIKSLVENYVRALKFDDSNRDENLFEKIFNLSRQNGIISPFTSYCLTDSRSGVKQYVNIIPPEERLTAGGEGELPYMKRLKTHEHFANIAKSQLADGSFRPPYMTAEEDVTEFTAQTLYEFLTECPDIELYFWQIRKALVFLLEEMEISEDANISEKFGEAISIWHDKFGGNDKISQKAAALSFIHRGK